MSTFKKYQLQAASSLRLLLTGLALTGGRRFSLIFGWSSSTPFRKSHIFHIDRNRQNDLQVVSEPEALFVCRNHHGDNSSTLTVNLMNSGTTTTGTSCRKKSAQPPRPWATTRRSGIPMTSHLIATSGGRILPRSNKKLLSSSDTARNPGTRANFEIIGVIHCSVVHQE
jgi:hypothetical protein